MSIKTNHKAKLIHYSIVIFFITITFNLVAQKITYTSNIQNFTAENGLSHKDIYVANIDNRGILWLGTRNGLNRFDGRYFKVFTTENGLHQNDIHKIYPLKNALICVHYNDIEFGTYQDFSIFHTVEERVLTFEEFTGVPLPFDKKKIDWIRFYNETIIFYINNRKDVWSFSFENGFKEEQLPNGVSVIGNPQHIHFHYKEGEKGFLKKVNKNGKTIFSIQPYFIKDFQNIYAINPNSSNENWIYCDGIYLVSNEGNAERFTAIDNAIQKYFPNEFPVLWQSVYLPNLNAFCHAHKNVFVLVHKSGEVLFETQFSDNVNLDSYVLVADETDNIFWIKTGEELYQIELYQNHFTKHLANQNYQSFRAIRQIGDKIYFNSYSGIFEYDKKDKTYSNILRHGVISITDKNQNLWFTEDRFIRKYNTISKVTSEYTVPNAHELWGLYFDKNRLWYSQEGLWYLDIETEEKGSVVYNEFKELKKHTVYYFHDLDNGNVLLCTTSGLYEWNLDKGIVARYWKDGKDKFQLPTSDFRHLYFDKKDKTYWLATGDKGLIHWNQETGESKVYKLHRFQSNIVHAVYADDYGNLWLSTENGIIQFNKSTELFRAYFPKDGTSTHEFNRISHFQDDEGILYFGSINGVTSFHPKDFQNEIKTKTQSKIVVLDLHQYLEKTHRLENLTKDYYQNNRLKMRSGDRFFTVNLALDNYSHNKEAIYYYRIKNVDETWSISKDNEISVSGLPYGNQIVEIKASLQNGHFSKVLEIPVKVMRPFYLTWWFGLLFMFWAIIMTYFIIQWRTKNLNRQKEILQEEVTKRTATIYEQAEKLRALDKTKSRFFANVSHELRTPLTLLLGPINSTLKRGNLDNRDFTMMQKAQQSGQQLLKLVGSILDLSKMESGKMELQETSTALFIFIRRLISAFESHAQREGIRFSFDYQAEKDLQLLLDKEKLEVILNNLLSNAMKFTQKGGQVSVTIKDETNQIKIVVKDTGRGIHSDDLPNVFNRFYQSEQKNAPTEGGTGIGLALSKEFAQLMQGDIRVESEWRKGSTFIVELPRNEVLGMVETLKEEVQAINVIQPTTDTTNSTETNNQQLLIVEDNRALRDYIKLILEPHFNIQTAENGQVALDFLSNNYQNKKAQPDLIISDFMMPEMDGFQLLTILKSRAYFRNIPVIMLTARAELQDKLNALRVGVDDYMVKPFDEDELIIRIENLLKNYEERQSFVQNETLVGVDEKSTIEISDIDQKWLEQAETIITNEIADSLFSVDYLAEKLSTPRKKLYKKIKQLTGLTPNQYIRTIRLKIAKDYLEQQTYKTVKEVAHQVGFQRVDYFSNLYKKEYGKSPIEYLR